MNIDDIMALAEEYATACDYYSDMPSDGPYRRLRAAIEQALYDEWEAGYAEGVGRYVEPIQPMIRKGPTP